MEVKLDRLKRFDKDKHAQLEGLLQWCHLMGLTGKDLVSLGGHIDRIQAFQEVEKNKAIVDGYQCDFVGSDRSIEDRFTILSVHGRYKFEQDGWGEVRVTSYKTKVRKTLRLGDYELGRMGWRKSWRYRALLDVHAGKFVLDF